MGRRFVQLLLLLPRAAAVTCPATSTAPLSTYEYYTAYAAGGGVLMETPRLAATPSVPNLVLYAGTTQRLVIRSVAWTAASDVPQGTNWAVAISPVASSGTAVPCCNTAFATVSGSSDFGGTLQLMSGTPCAAIARRNSCLGAAHYCARLRSCRCKRAPDACLTIPRTHASN